jgi:hypothetical protein
MTLDEYIENDPIIPLVAETIDGDEVNCGDVDDGGIERNGKCDVYVFVDVIYSNKIGNPWNNVFSLFVDMRIDGLRKILDLIRDNKYTFRFGWPFVIVYDIWTDAYYIVSRFKKYVDVVMESMYGIRSGKYNSIQSGMLSLEGISLKQKLMNKLGYNNFRIVRYVDCEEDGDRENDKNETYLQGDELCYVEKHMRYDTYVYVNKGVLSEYINPIRHQLIKFRREWREREKE